MGLFARKISSYFPLFHALTRSRLTFPSSHALTSSPRPCVSASFSPPAIKREARINSTLLKFVTTPKLLITEARLWTPRTF